MIRILLLAATIIFLAGCSPHEKAAPEILTRDVNIAVSQPCKVDTKNQRPNLMTWEQVRAAIDASPNVDAKAKVITSQLIAYMSWLPVVEDAMKGCASSK